MSYWGNFLLPKMVISFLPLPGGIGTPLAGFPGNSLLSQITK
jgi:hypothetical protein